MAPDRESRIDLGTLGSQSRAQQTKPKHYVGVSGKTPAKGRLKRKFGPALQVIPQQDETSPGKNATSVSTKSKSPWMSYTKLYRLQFGASDYFQVAEEKVDRKDPSSEQNPVVIVKDLTGFAADEHMEYIQRIKHKSFVPIRNIFLMGQECFVVFDFMPLSLSELAGHPLMNDLRLASILGQIIEGLMYLDHNSLEHTQLTCSNILVEAAGNVKLWAQEHIQGGSNRPRHVQSLRRITMHLIQGYIEEDGPDGPDRSQQFPEGSKFVSEMKKASSVDSLRKHPLLQLPWHKSRLAGMISLANIWADRGYKFRE